MCQLDCNLSVSSVLVDSSRIELINEVCFRFGSVGFLCRFWMDVSLKHQIEKKIKPPFDFEIIKTQSVCHISCLWTTKPKNCLYFFRKLLNQHPKK